MAHNISEDLMFYPFGLGAVVAGTTEQIIGDGTNAYVDTKGYTGAIFIAVMGTGEALNDLHVGQCDTSGGTYADLAGSECASTDADDPDCLVVCVRKKPLERYLRGEITRTTSAAVNAGICILYGDRAGPTANLHESAGEKVIMLISPAEGTK